MSDDIEQTILKIRELSRTESYAEALTIADGLAKSHPDKAEAWAARGHVNAMQGNYQEAVSDVSKAIGLSPDELDYWFTRGRYFFALRAYAEAVVDLTRTIELCDRHGLDYYRVPSYLLRADAHLRLKLYDKARADCAHVPDNVPMWTDSVRCKADILAECP